MTQSLELGAKDFKSTIIKMLKKLHKKINITHEKRVFQKRNIN